ncbi:MULTISPECIES: hypothetical protein [unclassified Sphingopyxis]|jgi:hypothetical protein|uniref:hypothetical protein n=1 Tax=unclassified Sphingopyxis TaxID=2614943 RepID=UPI002864D369|nr:MULTISPECIES: hypothetical protein [unclassified Sphingopyxis]MDR6832370.1 hypothetical protein [Sphingopyxis sp. BE122]MDR7228113.1 hypothetical protein [Sphingopyxis sp. BE259]
MRTTTISRSAGALAALLLAGTATGAHAQFSGDPGSGSGEPSSASAPASEPGRSAKRAEARRSQRQVDVSPYLEVGQVLTADLKNGGDVLTYTNVAVGVDAAIVTNRAELAATVRYEHRFGWGSDSGDSDTISGLARGRIEVARGLNLEGGALATRTRADNQGADSGLFIGDASNVANLYSVYAGPTFTRRIGGLDVGAGYRFGYTKVDVDEPAILSPGSQPQDIFDSSTNHVAWASVGARPGDLPFGWQLSGGYEREDASQLDQRFEGKYARADVTMPIGPTVALLGGVGYEDIEIGQRDPVVDANGVPLRDANGRFITDKSTPRQLSFDTDGLIWDAGVMWQPSRRTSATARVGRRYGDTIYTGSFSYRADHATTIQVGVYDGLSSLGRGLSGGLAALPTQFDPTRNPIGGAINPCVFGQEGGGCLNNQLGNATSAQYRSRGIQATIGSRFAGWSYGVGIGYDQRKLLAPLLSPIASLNGIKDESYYLFLSAGRQLDVDSDLSLSGYVNYFDNGAPGAGDVQSAGLSAAYSRRFWRGLTGTAAASLNAFDQDGFNSQLIGSALVGLRYNF